MRFFIALGVLVGAGGAASRAAAPPDVTGVYALFSADDTGGKPVGHIVISSQRGAQFLVGIAIPTGEAKQDWEGRGVIEGAAGAYEWVFPDGKTGRTTFTLEADGSLKGRVRGSGVDWNYVAKRLDPARTQANLVGTYALTKEGDEENGVIGHMSISSQRGAQFLVGIAIPTGDGAHDWEGRGVVDGEKGYYEWAFPDGKKGRTTFKIDGEGRLHGGVDGKDLEWSYIARRLEGPVRMPKK